MSISCFHLFACFLIIFVHIGYSYADIPESVINDPSRIEKVMNKSEYIDYWYTRHRQELRSNLYSPSENGGKLRYDPLTARQMLSFAGASYCAPKSIVNWSCSFCHEIQSFRDVVVIRNQTTGMQAVSGYWTPDETSHLPHADIGPSIVVIFKGSDNFKNIISDFTFAPHVWVPFSGRCPKCAIHSGFFDTYASLREGVFRELEILLNKYPSTRIYITGHSMGAAMSHLFALDAKLRYPDREFVIYTFGKPRLGNPDFVDFFEKTLSTTPVFRITHFADPVVHTPFVWQNYVHSSHEVFYNEFNQNYIDCSDYSGPKEDIKQCASSMSWTVLLTDHFTYLGLDFPLKWVQCKL